MFIALLSENFHKAQYTDHEVGIAVGLEKTVLPISIDETMPYGFLTRFQAKKMSPEIDVNQVEKIFKEFRSNTVEITGVDDDLIYSLLYAESFSEANYAVRKLSKYTEFSDTQINAIARGFIGNEQIRGSYAADWCARILKKNWNRIDKNLQEKLKDTTYTTVFSEL